MLHNNTLSSIWKACHASAHPSWWIVQHNKWHLIKVPRSSFYLYCNTWAGFYPWLKSWSHLVRNKETAQWPSSKGLHTKLRVCFLTKQFNKIIPILLHIHSGLGYFGCLHVPWTKWSWIELLSREMQNLFLKLGIDYSKLTYPKLSYTDWTLHPCTA